MFSPEQLAALKSKGLVTDEQVKQKKRDDAKKEEREAQAQKKKLAQQERNMGQSRSKGGSKGGQDNRWNREPRPVISQEVHGVYGKIRKAGSSSKPQAIATAPYNFIPLPDGILPSPLNAVVGNILLEPDGKEKTALSKEEKSQLSEAFHHYLTVGKHYSGTIELSIENITPLFIGGNKESSESFAPAGRTIIPGSELRGMTKNLFKMVTCGGWQPGEDMVDRHLYYRCMMASHRDPQNKELCVHYTDYMTSMDAMGKIKKNARPGFLVKRRSGYVIYPLMENKLHSIPIKSYMAKYHLSDKDVRKSCVLWDGQTAYIQAGLLSTRKLLTKDEIDRSTEAQRKTWGKQYYKYMSLSDLDKSKCYEVPAEIIAEYQDDKNRRGMDLIKRSPQKGDKMPERLAGLEEYQSIIPCFFFLEDGSDRVKSFGHGQSYRIPYDCSTMDAVEEEMKKGTIDFAAAVFGKSSKAASWASRVAFDDAVPEKLTGTCGKAKAHALMQPNPTSFQLYLAQDHKEKLLFWDSHGAKIRGYKLYWHNKDGHDWKASETERMNLENERDENAASLLKEINPLKSGNRFKGNIRFRDLTKEELGALMKVFYLAQDGEDIAYKIGMGKSIGLGSIRIVPELYLEDGSRYQELFDENGWNNSLKKADPKEFVAAYEDYVQEVQNGSLLKSYRNTLQNMRLMLDYRNVTNIKEWEAATSPIDGNTKEPNPDKKDERFQLRSVLPTVRDVIEKARKGM